MVNQTIISIYRLIINTIEKSVFPPIYERKRHRVIHTVLKEKFSFHKMTNFISKYYEFIFHEIQCRLFFSKFLEKRIIRW